MKKAIAELDKTLLANVQTTADATRAEFTLRRFATVLLGAMGALGLLLAMVGLFGVLAWEVTRRTPEIGIRMALGASRRVVSRAVVRDALWLVGAGTAVGLAAAVVATLPLRSFLAGVSTADPLALGGVAGLLLAVGPSRECPARAPCQRRRSDDGAPARVSVLCEVRACTDRAEWALRRVWAVARLAAALEGSSDATRHARPLAVLARR